MTGYIYQTANNEIVCIIRGNNREAIEDKAASLGYIGYDEYKLVYDRGPMMFAVGGSNNVFIV